MQKYVPFTKSKQPDRSSAQNITNSTVAVHGECWQMAAEKTAACKPVLTEEALTSDMSEVLPPQENERRIKVRNNEWKSE